MAISMLLGSFVILVEKLFPAAEGEIITFCPSTNPKPTTTTAITILEVWIRPRPCSSLQERLRYCSSLQEEPRPCSSLCNMSTHHHCSLRYILHCSFQEGTNHQLPKTLRLTMSRKSLKRWNLSRIHLRRSSLPFSIMSQQCRTTTRG